MTAFFKNSETRKEDYSSAAKGRNAYAQAIDNFKQADALVAPELKDRVSSLFKSAADNKTEDLANQAKAEKLRAAGTVLMLEAFLAGDEDAAAYAKDSQHNKELIACTEDKAIQRRLEKFLPDRSAGAGM